MIEDLVTKRVAFDVKVVAPLGLKLQQASVDCVRGSVSIWGVSLG